MRRTYSRNSAHRTRWWRDMPFLLLAVAFGVALGSMAIVSSFRPLSDLETILFQVVTLITGLFASYRFGRNAARDAAFDVIRPHARSAMRRLLALADSLYRLSDRIEGYKVDDNGNGRLDEIQAIIDEQIPHGRSAVEDWRDIVPGDVEEILQQWSMGQEGERSGDTH